MGLKFLYYVDTSANWTLFTLGMICVPLGIGGMLLVTPVMGDNVYSPWYHAIGVWVGLIFLAVAMMMPFARFHATFLRVAVVLTYLTMIVGAIGLGVGIDEFTCWFENPTVKTFGGDAVDDNSTRYVSHSAIKVVEEFAEFDLFHKTRVIVVMLSTLLGICMLLFRIVTLGLVIFDEFTTRGYDVFTPEEEMMQQAMADREMVEEYNLDKQRGAQQLLYATGNKERKLTDIKENKEFEIDGSYDENIKALIQLGKQEREFVPQSKRLVTRIADTEPTVIPYDLPNMAKDDECDETVTYDVDDDYPNTSEHKPFLS